MPGGQKKVIVRPIEGAPMSGYLPASGFTSSEGFSILGTDGKLISLQMNEIKMISYVRDFNLQDAADPERMGRKNFVARPRAEGLWLRLTFVDGDVLEGLTAADLSLWDAMLEDGGLFLTPPDMRSNTQRVFVPRSALSAMEILGVIRPALVKKTPANVERSPQPGLFGEE